MFDHVPSEIQQEILKRFQVKPLIRFRSVSKSWKSFIDSSDFVANYTSQRQHLLFRYHNPYTDSVLKYVSIVDDDTFPRQTVTLTLHPLVKQLKSYQTIGSSCGLLCLFNRYFQGSFKGWFGPMNDMDLAVIWNPSISKVVAVVVPNVTDGIGGMYHSELGFAVCRGDPKIVKVTYIIRVSDMDSATSIPWQVEVFTLSAGAWRSPYGSNRPSKSIDFGCGQSISVDGVCYWLATDRSTVEYFDFGARNNMIVSFDMTSEEFREVNLPYNLVCKGSMGDLFLSNLKETLVVLERNIREELFVVWSMEDGVPNSFTKLFTIHGPTITKVLVFRKCGEPIIKALPDDCITHSIFYYEPNSKDICNLGLLLGTNEVGKFKVHSYSETLLLLDQPSYLVFENGKCHFEDVTAELRT